MCIVLIVVATVNVETSSVKICSIICARPFTLLPLNCENVFMYMYYTFVLCT